MLSGQINKLIPVSHDISTEKKKWEFHDYGIQTRFNTFYNSTLQVSKLKVQKLSHLLFQDKTRGGRTSFTL
jgi:hypothetical protein